MTIFSSVSLYLRPPQVNNCSAIRVKYPVNLSPFSFYHEYPFSLDTLCVVTDVTLGLVTGDTTARINDR